MKAPTFWHGVVAAAVLAACASAMMATLTPFLGPAIVLRLAIPLLAAAYMLFFFRSGRQRPACDYRLGCVDRHGKVRRPADGFDDRHHAREFFVERYRFRVGPRAFAADVQ